MIPDEDTGGFPDVTDPNEPDIPSYEAPEATEALPMEF